MKGAVEIANGFAEVEAGLWLMSRGQPAAFFGKAERRRRKGWRVCDRSRLDLVETTASAKCADSSRPFLTHIPCAAPIFALSSKVLVAPSSARRGARTIKAIPMSVRNALCVTEFGQDDSAGSDVTASAWIVMATGSRTERVQVADGDTFAVRPDSVVAWTGKLPTGFCPKLSLLDVLLPRGSRDLLFTFYGPGIVWIEGSSSLTTSAFKPSSLNRRAYGV